MKLIKYYIKLINVIREGEIKSYKTEKIDRSFIFWNRKFDMSGNIVKLFITDGEVIILDGVFSLLVFFLVLQFSK